MTSEEAYIKEIAHSIHSRLLPQIDMNQAVGCAEVVYATTVKQLQKDKAELKKSNKVLVKELKEVKSNIHRFRGFSIEECNNYQYKIGNIILANEQEVK